MELNLQRPLLFFDIESTGLNIAVDGIIELSFVKIMPDNQQNIKTWRIRPWDYEKMAQIPMSEGAAEVTGVHDEDLKDAKTFLEYAPEIASWLKGCDFGGFNSLKFDLPLLAEEFERARQYCRRRSADPHATPEKRQKALDTLSAIDIDLHEGRMVDVQNIFHFMEPRNLRAAYRFYCGGKDFDNAHTAEADTLATVEVLKAQLDMYKEADEAAGRQALKNDVQALADIRMTPKSMDFAGRIKYNAEGEPCISFGKHAGKTVEEVFNTERSYFGWIENGQFTLDTKAQFRKLEDEFKMKYREAARQAAERPATQEDLNLLAAKFNNR